MVDLVFNPQAYITFTGLLLSSKSRWPLPHLFFSILFPEWQYPWKRLLPVIYRRFRRGRGLPGGRNVPGSRETGDAYVYAVLAVTDILRLLHRPLLSKAYNNHQTWHGRCEASIPFPCGIKRIIHRRSAALYFFCQLPSITSGDARRP